MSRIVDIKIRFTIPEFPDKDEMVENIFEQVEEDLDSLKANLLMTYGYAPGIEIVTNTSDE